MKIVLLGCGNLITSIFEGISKHENLLKENNFFTYTPSATRAKSLALTLNGQYVSSFDSLKDQDIYILGFKPQTYTEAILEYKSIIPDGAQVWSVLAGIGIDRMKVDFPNNHILRIMPNICSKVGKGINLYLSTENFPKTGLEKFHQLFGAVGSSYLMSSDDELDYITGVSGSGPALIYNFLESLEASLEKSSLSHEDRKSIIANLASGSIALFEQSSDDLSTLRQNVTSKKGVTHEALETYRRANLESITLDAIKAAYRRSSELRSE